MLSFFKIDTRQNSRTSEYPWLNMKISRETFLNSMHDLNKVSSEFDLEICFYSSLKEFLTTL
jgi:hypothetical protein